MATDPAPTRPGFPDPRPGRVLLGYVVLLLVAVALFFLVRSHGETLRPRTEGVPITPGTVAASGKTAALGHVMIALVAILVVGRLLSGVFAAVGQPPVIGEVIAGIVLGPSLLGYVWPSASQFVLPDSVGPYLGVLAQLGVVIYMFLVGLELDLGSLRRHAYATVAISHASIVVPFSLGAVLALGLYPSLAPAGVPFTGFALFMGVAMAITAFPVLARILTDRGMDRTELGRIGRCCAAIDDATAWCLLAFAVGVVRAELRDALVVLALALVFVAVLLLVVRPLAARWLTGLPAERVTGGLIAWMLVGLLLSALATEAIGIHALFGAFLFGAALPHDSAVARVLHGKLHDLVTILLLPAFFAITGMRTEIGLLAGAEQWLLGAAILAVATLGKFGGTFAAARLTGLGVRDAAALGVLMNTRGLMELIVLNVGLDLGIISRELFAMMVLMALATTLATAPVLQWIGHAEAHREGV